MPRLLVPAVALWLTTALGGCAGTAAPSVVSPNPSTALPTASSQPAVASTNTDLAPPTAPPFRAPSSYKVGQDPGNVAVADLDGDGSLDVVSTRAWDNRPGSESSGEISILFGDGNGTFRPAVTIAGPRTEFIAALDVNGDGKPDLVSPSGSAVAVLIGKGDGSFAEPIRYDVKGDMVYAWAWWLATGDLDGDGVTDLVVSVYGAAGPSPTADGQLAVLLNNGDGTFSDAVFHEDRAAWAVALGDFDGDGNLDAASADWDGTVRLFAGDGKGNLGLPSESEIGAQGIAIVAGDLNGDRSPDLLTGNDNSRSISVLLGKGDGSFGAAQKLPAGNTYSVAMTDLDGDGALDLLSAGAEGAISFWRGRGDGTFAATANIATNVDPRAVATGDFNADGKLDLVVDCSGCMDEQGATSRVSAVIILLAE